MFSVYILQSGKDKRTYVGFCKNINLRLHEHNSGKVKATKHRRPFIILFMEEANNLSEAKQREKYWKSGAGRRKLKYFFREGFPPIQNF
jgi:putative endonuclease